MRRFGALVTVLPSACLVLAPVLTMVLLSLCRSRFPALPWPGWSSTWYHELIADEVLKISLVRSALVGVATSAICTFLGFGSGVLLSHLPKRKIAMPLLGLSLPSLLPFILVGFAFMGFARTLGLLRTLTAVILAHSVVFSPVVTAIFLQRVRDLNPEVEDAAWELGASGLTILRIIAGQIKGTALSAALIVFVLSWDEYVIAALVSGFDKTYPVYVRTILEATFSPEIYAIGTVVALLSLTIAATALFIFKSTRNE